MVGYQKWKIKGAGRDSIFPIVSLSSCPFHCEDSNIMAKRFTDSRKWDDPWFLELPLEYKMIWIHILDKCNHAGIYKVNVKMINFCLNTSLTKNDIEKVFINRFYKINNHKWFISKFIEFQYGVLSEKNRVHNSVIEILKKEGLYKVYRQTLIGLKDKNKDKNKVKNMVKDKDKEKEMAIKFEKIWKVYPNTDGHRMALKHFLSTVKTEKDWLDINKALTNYLKHLEINAWKKVKNGSTWFNNWQDWVDWVEPKKREEKQYGVV